MAERNASYTNGVVAGNYARPAMTVKSDGVITAIADNSVACILSNCLTDFNPITWGTKLYDPLNMSNVANTAITVPIAGVYLVTFNFFLNEAPFNTTRSFAIRYGIPFQFDGNAQGRLQPPGNNLWSVSGVCVIVCAAGDIIELFTSFGGNAVDPDVNSSWSVQRL